MNRIAISLLALCALILGGCGSDARSQTPAVDAGTAGSVAGHVLDTIGAYGTWIGGIGMAVCAIVFAATFIPIVQPIIAGLAAFGLTRKVIAEAGIISFGLVLLGLAFLYLGHHVWLLSASIGLIALALAIRYHTWLATHIYPSPAVATAAPGAPATPVK